MTEKTPVQKKLEDELETFKRICRSKFGDDEGRRLLELLIDHYLISQPVYSAKHQHNAESYAHMREGQNNLIRYLMESAGLEARVSFVNRLV